MGVLSKFLSPRPAGAAIGAAGPAEARDLLRQGALLVDVREQGEWDAGHAPKARHVPLRSITASLDRLPRDRTLVLVCRSGNRSGRAAKLLAKQGFEVVNLVGGMNAWKAAGLPVVSARGKPGRVA